MRALNDTKAWLPNAAWSAPGGVISDCAYHDFDAQSERLGTHDQEYLQLSDGPFRGRFVSCLLGSEVSLHIEHANQALSQSIAGAAETYAIGIALCDGPVFRANGTEVGCDSVFILPPKTDLHLYSPKQGTIMACAISRTLFETQLAKSEHLQDWLQTPNKEIVCLRAPSVADQLRQDAHSALIASVTDTREQLDKAAIGAKLIDRLMTALLLSMASDKAVTVNTSPASFHRFLASKRHLTLSSPLTHTLPAISQDLALSKRTLQHAFTQEVSLGISSYQRRLRLHAARRALRANTSTKQNIGDIAAQHGFWNWSHFSQQYRQLFGESPSDTVLKGTNAD